jgi:pilus assembly protein Flp/PilA
MSQIMYWFKARLGALVIRGTIVGDEAGQALVEYGLILGLVAAVCITVMITLGTGVFGLFESVTSEIGNYL